MTFKTLEKTTFGKIKIGEVFAVEGCWRIEFKISDVEALVLAKDYSTDFSFRCIDLYQLLHGSDEIVYRLPKSVQSLWVS